jgi:dTDP-4-amino-4,6-dideoxy-D-glucose acyltransferase
MQLRYYSADELAALLGTVGTNVQIESTALLIEPQNIHIGSNVRIDAGCILSAGVGIRIGNRVHIGAATHVFASGAALTVDDFCGVSSRVSFFTSNDDYSSGHMANPMVPMHYRKVRTGEIMLGRHVVIGCGSIIMPGVKLGFGASIGALSFVNKAVPALAIVSGNPARVIGHRDGNQLATLEKKLIREQDG